MHLVKWILCRQIQISTVFMILWFSPLFSLLSCPDITIYKYETKTNIGIVLVVVISSNIYEIFLETWHHWHTDNVVLQVVISDQTLSQVSISWCQHDIVLTQSQHLLINWIFLDQLQQQTLCLFWEIETSKCQVKNLFHYSIHFNNSRD